MFIIIFILSFQRPWIGLLSSFVPLLPWGLREAGSESQQFGLCASKRSGWLGYSHTWRTGKGNGWAFQQRPQTCCEQKLTAVHWAHPWGPIYSTAELRMSSGAHFRRPVTNHRSLTFGSHQLLPFTSVPTRAPLWAFVLSTVCDPVVESGRMTVMKNQILEQYLSPGSSNRAKEMAWSLIRYNL